MSDGATKEEQLLAACKLEQLELLKTVLNSKTGVNINATDGVGNTALHYACQSSSLSCIELLLSVKNIKVNLANRMELETPLHKALHDLSEPDLTRHIVGLLVEHGADPRLKNRIGQRPIDLVPLSIKPIRTMLLQATLAANMVPQNNDSDDSEEDQDSD
ncbi:hypothetical protein BB561_001634 [Smittium simulii]|uniref:Uncharacterized protein n=1 Tax=Smittium simulii TaxID=133385 RepID=A0A2T9YTX1_9FUNG|nr:hypothetical protein BB561_001634 [Smittium simulii]